MVFTQAGVVLDIQGVEAGFAVHRRGSNQRIVQTHAMGFAVLTPTDEEFERLVSPGIALIKANKRFDFFIYPGEPHGYRGTGPYNQRMLMEYFAEHLLGDYYRGNGEIK